MLVLSHAQGHVMLETLVEENGEWVLRVEGKIKCFVSNYLQISPLGYIWNITLPLGYRQWHLKQNVQIIEKYNIVYDWTRPKSDGSLSVIGCGETERGIEMVAFVLVSLTFLL